MSLTKQTFEEFLVRLRYHNRGDGVGAHGTTNPIFEVRERFREYGIDEDFADGQGVINDGTYYSFDEIEEVLEEYQQSLFEEFRKYVELETGLPFSVISPKQRLEHIQDWFVETDTGEYKLVNWRWSERHISSHLTREGAVAFITRKGHDYNELFVWVGSNYWAPEFNSIIKALLDGQVTWNDQKIPAPENELYYLQDSRTFVGNDMLFWAIDAKGYTTDTRRAHLYTKEEAFAMNSDRSSDIPWPKSYIDNKCRPAADIQDCRLSAALGDDIELLQKPKKVPGKSCKCDKCGKFLKSNHEYLPCPSCGSTNTR